MYDLIVIGGGTTGLSAAEAAVMLDLDVALIERDKIGGDCTWTGCIPSKALIKVARVAHAARTASHYGVQTSAPTVDMKQVKEYVHGAIHHIYEEESPDVLRGKGIDIILEEARFIDKNTLQVGDRQISGKTILLATGAHPFIPPVEGLADVPYHTYQTIFDNERLPDHLIVMGAGTIGAELGQSYRRLGADVTLIDVDLLPREPEDVRQTMRTVFEREGIRLVKGLAGAVAEGDDGSITVTMKDSGEIVTGDMLLVTVGRHPNVKGMNLEAAGVKYSEEGITVNKHLRTSTSHIYAAGDCTGSFQFTHYAGWQAFQALRNAYLPLNDKGIMATVPYAIFTDPEIARAGITEEAARQKHGDKVRVDVLPNTQTDRTITDNDMDGFIKIVYLPSGEILGATIVAERAGDAIIEFIFAMEHNIKYHNLPITIHPYPTIATGIQLLAADFAAEKVLSGILGKAAKLLIN